VNAAEEELQRLKPQPTKIPESSHAL